MPLLPPPEPFADPPPSVLASYGDADGGALALDRTTISVVVKKLEQRGLVERTVSEKDRRSKPVSITEDGARLIHDVLPAAETAQDRMLAPLTAAERAQFMRLLGKVANGNNSESRAPLRR